MLTLKIFICTNIKFCETNEGIHRCMNREKVEKRFQEMKKFIEDSLYINIGEKINIQILNTDFERSGMNDIFNSLMCQTHNSVSLLCLSRNIMDLSMVDYVVFDADQLTNRCSDANIISQICDSYNLLSNSISLQHFDAFDKVRIGSEINNYMIKSHRWGEGE